MTLKEKIYSINSTVRFYYIMSIFPFLVLSTIILLPSMAGVSIITEGYTAPNPPISEEDKQLMRDIFSVIFFVYPIYSFGLLIGLVFILLTTKEIVNK